METTKIPSITRLGKLFIQALAILPIAATVWYAAELPGGDPDSRYFTWVMVISMIFLSCFLTPYFIKIASTRFTPDGVEQLAFFSGGRLCSTTSLKWSDVRQVMYKHFAYTLVGQNAKVLVHLACFSNYEEVANFVNGELPKDAVWVKDAR